MSSERHRNKNRYIFKGGNFILSPLNSKNVSLNFISANKKENNMKNNTKLIINNLNTKKSRKNLNQEFIKSNPNLLVLSRANNSYISDMKMNNPKKNNINLTNIDVSYMKKLCVNKKAKENSYFLNSKSHNKNNLGEKKLSYEYIKTDIPLSNSNLFNKGQREKSVPNINLLFPSKNNIQKSNSHFYDDFLGSSFGLFKKDLPNFRLNPEKSFDERNIIHKPKDDPVRSESGTNLSTNDSKKVKKKIINVNINPNKKGENTRKGPEELHWYFVKSIQEGKKLLAKFDC